jgi:hypothetical protein
MEIFAPAAKNLDLNQKKTAKTVGDRKKSLTFVPIN